MNLSQLRCLHLCSPMLPVGGFSFSQGLEYAIETRWLVSVQDIGQWLDVVMAESMAYLDLPVVLRLKRAYADGNVNEFQYWSDFLLASRESAELLQAERVMGSAMNRLLHTLSINMGVYQNIDPSFIGGFAVAAQFWALNDEDALGAYLWIWLENQITAATKLLPLGQSDAQRLLLQKTEFIPPIVTLALNLRDEDVGASLPSLAMASAWHETQYSRLFRS